MNCDSTSGSDDISVSWGFDYNALGDATSKDCEETGDESVVCCDIHSGPSWSYRPTEWQSAFIAGEPESLHIFTYAKGVDHSNQLS